MFEYNVRCKLTVEFDRLIDFLSTQLKLKRQLQIYLRFPIDSMKSFIYVCYKK